MMERTCYVLLDNFRFLKSQLASLYEVTQLNFTSLNLLQFLC
jgi:hypothetical protein